MDSSGWNMYVFREGRKTVSGESLRSRLLFALRRLADSTTEDNCISALIAAGELECALADAGSESAQTAAALTDELADALLKPRTVRVDPRFERLSVPDEVRLSVAEGFAYYALHPLKLASLVSNLSLSKAARVIGLRSIGTTLGAVTAAALRASGIEADRISVRPTGHPYDRNLTLTDAEQQWLSQTDSGAQFLVVDEGPGLSGSSFLAVAEALERAGVPRSKIIMLGSREPDPHRLRAPSAAERWTRFQFSPVDSRPLLPPGAEIEIGAGAWRRNMPFETNDYPAAWTQLESARYWSTDSRRQYQFQGYGHYGEVRAERACKLAAGRFAPAFFRLEKGFGVTEVVPGRRLSASELNSELLRHMAEYCAFRAREFRSEEPSPELESMAVWNWECEFGSPLLPVVSLPVVNRVVADARMMPYEWLRADDGRLLKLNGISHGDDHFFPGPCDIAWDLAGAIVEWQMSPDQGAALVASYRDLTGDDVRERLPSYLLAYTVFRMGWSKMAAHASAGSFDEPLLYRDYLRYRDKARQLGSGSAEIELPTPVKERAETARLQGTRPAA